MPEVGSTCWVCRPSEQNRAAFVIGWTMVNEGGSLKGGRPQLNPGDIQLSTRDGNFVTLRRGGVLQVGSTPICQRIYIPIRNIIQDYAENYEMHTPAGDLTWLVLRKEDDGDGHQRCEYNLAVKEYADDPNNKPIAFLKIGSHGEGNDTILTLQTRDKGGGSVQLSLEITKSGEVKWTFKKFTLDVQGEAALKIKDLFKIDALADMMITIGTTLKVEAKTSVAIAAGSGSLALGSAGAALKGAQVNLGDATAPVVVDSGALAGWFAQIVSLCAAHYPPIVIPPPPVYISTKVKA